MKRWITAALVLTLCGCGDFVDENGNTSIRQVAQGIQSLGDRLSEMGQALERDADVAAVPWTDLSEVLPREIDGASRLMADGDDATDRNGAGMSMAHIEYAVRGDSMFIGVADLGALRSGVGLALRWIAPVFGRGDLDGDAEEITIDGHPAIRIRDEDDEGMVIALIVEGRFAVIAGSENGNERRVREALRAVDYDRLEDWVDYGTR